MINYDGYGILEICWQFQMLPSHVRGPLCEFESKGERTRYKGYSNKGHAWNLTYVLLYITNVK
jgi:hypothetical protein